MQDTIQIIPPPQDTTLEIQQVDSIFPFRDTLIQPDTLPREAITNPPVKSVQKSFPDSSKSPDIPETISLSDSIDLQAIDSIDQQPFMIEKMNSGSFQTTNSYLSRNISSENIPDWYFIIIISVLVAFVLIRIAYFRFISVLFESSYNYLLASKIIKESSVIQKRVWIAFDFIYLINGSLFLFLLFRFFNWDFAGENDYLQLAVSFGFLAGLMLIRSIIMRIIGHIFDRYSLFTEFLYHFFIYNKVIGLVLFPFILTIPYTRDQLHIILIYTALSMVGIVYFMRLIRAVIFTLKKEVLIFYLILYLCTLEILPVLVIIKLILSLN